jgi:putative ABC transport system permease protein
MSTTTAKDATTRRQRERLRRPRLPARELLGLALQGFRTRRLRAALSALGIAIGIGAMVAVVGVSASAQANLLAEIDALGTNLLTVAPGQSFLGQQEVLPDTAAPMIGHMHDVLSDAAVYQVSAANVYRTALVPVAQTGGIGVDASSENLPQVMGARILLGHFLDAVASGYPEMVLGYQAAQILQITQVGGNMIAYVGNTWSR